MAKLSSAAQAVLDALLNAPVNSGQVCNGKAPQIKLAAALRAAAEQLYDSPSVDYLWEIADALETLPDNTSPPS